MHDTGLKNNFFKSVDVAILGYCCGVFTYQTFLVPYLSSTKTSTTLLLVRVKGATLMSNHLVFGQVGLGVY